MAGLAEVKAYRHPNHPRWPSAYPLYPHFGSRLPTFHDEPELFGGPLRKGKDVGDSADGVRAAAGSTVTGTLRSTPSRQGPTASMWVILQAGDKPPGAALQHLNVNFLNNALTASRSRFFCVQCERKSAS